MAFRHGKYSEVTVDGNDLSAFCDDQGFNIDADTAEVSTFGNQSKDHVKGQYGATLELSGSYDPTETTGPAHILEAIILEDDDPVPVIAYPGGNVAGQRSRAFNAFVTNYREDASVGDKVGFSATLLATGDVTAATIGA
jgi:hypothetical protein